MQQHHARMKSLHSRTAPFHGVKLRLALALTAACSFAAQGQTIPNASFETDTFTVSPGYVSGNAAITGWTASPPEHVGLNPAGDNVFANNGVIPNGKNVAFLEAAGPATLGTTISGLTAGTTYKLTFRANASTSQTPNLHVAIDDQEMLFVQIHASGPSSPYTYIALEFTASAASHTLKLTNDADGNTLLVDDFAVAPSSGRWATAAWTGDADSGVDANFFYTHAYNFGSAASPTINGVTFTGVAGGNPNVAGSFSTTLLGNVFNNDSNGVLDSSTALATDFIYGGTITTGNNQAITIKGLTPGRAYVATIYTVGWESPDEKNRWATFNVGGDRLTLNQDALGDNSGQRITYNYTADTSGMVTLQYAPIDNTGQSIHTYGFSNREAVSRNVAPTITQDPTGTTVSEGVAVTFSVGATAIPTATYLWRFKGNPIDGATGATYTIPAVTAANTGNYDVVVTNPLGSVTSKVAKLTVGVALVNPSFEADTFTSFPGYVSGNGPITGWDSLPNHGINPGGGSPFADNGAFPNGAQVAFMQGDGALSQTVAGLTPNTEYYVHYYENARGGNLPYLAVKIGGTTVVPAHVVTPVGGSNPYHEIYSDVFAATDAQQLLEFVKSNPLGGDTTALVDNVALVAIPAGTAPVVTADPKAASTSVGGSATFTAHAIGSLPLSYVWLKNGTPIDGQTGPTLTLTGVQKPDDTDYSVRVTNGAGTVTSAAAHLTVFEPIADLYNTGVDDRRALVANGAADPHYTLIQSDDTAYPGPQSFVINDNAFPIGPWLGTTPDSKWIGPRADANNGNVPGNYTYRTWFNVGDRDPTSVIIVGRWLTDNTGVDILVNGVSVPNVPLSGSFTDWKAFTLANTNVTFVHGTNTIDFVMNNAPPAGPTGLRVEYTLTNLRIPPGVAPSILSSPVSQQVAIGDTVSLSGSAKGSAPLTYQWLKNGKPVANATNLTLSFTNVTAAVSGIYTLSVSNAVGVAVTDPASVCVSLQPLAGIVFGTGVDTNGVLLDNSSTDPHYILSASADESYPGPDAFVVIDGQFPIGPWLASGPNSKWIAPLDDQTSGNAGGAYTYTTAFDLTGVDASSFQIVGGWATDNGGTDIRLNGVSLGLVNTVQFASLTPFKITGGFLPGKNTLDFVVNNEGTAASPTGLRVDLKAYLNLQPKLSVSATGGNVTVSWSNASPCQTLQSAPSVTGPWTDLPEATSPYAVPAGPTQFFRILNP
jgi:hypothetical protein